MAKDVKELFKSNDSNEEVRNIELLSVEQDGIVTHALVTTNKRVLKVKL